MNNWKQMERKREKDAENVERPEIPQDRANPSNPDTS